MTTVGGHVKIAAIGVAASVILIFAEVTLGVLLPVVIGASLMMMGVAMAYRPPSVLGFLAVLTVSATAIDVQTLTDVSNVFAATVSLYVPSVVMAWASLSAEPGESVELRLRTKAFAKLVVTMAICILSVPAFAFLTGVLFPGVSMRISTMAEMSILLLAVSAVALMLARSSPEPKREPSEVASPAE